MGGRGSGINKQKKGAPKSNKAQNRRSDARREGPYTMKGMG